MRKNEKRLKLVGTALCEIFTYLDVLDVFPTQGVKETKTEMIGTAVCHRIATDIEKRDAIWPKDM